MPDCSIGSSPGPPAEGKRPTTQELRIGVEGRSDAVVLNVVGEIDYGNVARLRSALVDATQEPSGLVVVDLDAVPYLDSTALSVLIQAKRRFGSEGTALLVQNPSERVRRIFELSGVADYLLV